MFCIAELSIITLTSQDKAPRSSITPPPPHPLYQPPNQQFKSHLILSEKFWAGRSFRAALEEERVVDCKIPRVLKLLKIYSKPWTL